MRTDEMIGQKVNRLRVLGFAARNQFGHKMFLCRCDCGKEISARCASVRSGWTKSCGCLQKDVTRRIFTRHGLSHTGLNAIWRCMWSRCTNPNHTRWMYYGGRGIGVCDRWKSFENFLADMGERPSPRHTIDRVDGNGNYEPSNCRWATQTQQLRNTRRNHVIEAFGKRQCATEWAEQAGISLGGLLRRLNAGWSIEKALTKPSDPRCVKAWATRRLAKLRLPDPGVPETADVDVLATPDVLAAVLKATVDGI